MAALTPAAVIRSATKPMFSDGLQVTVAVRIILATGW